MGAGLQHHRGFQDLLFAAAQIAGQHAELGREQGEPRQHLVDRLPGSRPAQGIGAELEILAHGHQREVAAALRHEADAELQPFLGRQALDGAAAEMDRTAEIAVLAIDRAQQGRLAGAVGADDRADAAGCDVDREINHDRLVGVADRELVDREDRHQPPDSPIGSGLAQIGFQNARIAADQAGRSVGDLGA